MRLIICDLCKDEFEDKKEVYTFNPVKADRARGADRFDVCTSCVPDWMLDEDWHDD